MDGFCIWMTGLPSAGKTTIGAELASSLRARGCRVELLDGDEIRRGLSSDLGFDRVSRETHAHRVTFVAKVLARNGVIPIVTLISPYRSSRARARAEIGRFVEVYISTPLDVCEQRDVKGLYRKARAGEIKEMTGVDDPYEVPETPDITVGTVGVTPRESAESIVKDIEKGGWLKGVRRSRSGSRVKTPAEAKPARTSSAPLARSSSGRLDDREAVPSEN